MSKVPRVSVIIPTYSCEDYIVAAVETVLAQTYQDFELIVVDDGSIDNTRSVLQPYLDRIIYLYQENQGESAARNHGIQVAQGEYIAFLDSDDLWLPHKLERQVAVMDTLAGAVLANSYSYVIDAAGERIAAQGNGWIGRGEPGLRYVFENLVMDNFIASIDTVMVRKRFLLDGVPFDPAIQWGEDWDLWLRLSLKGPFAFVPEPLACYRIRQPKRRLNIEASDEFVRQNEMILDKAFAAVAPEHETLRPKAFAALYLRSAMKNFELGDTTRGSRYVAQVLRVDSAVAREGTAFSQRVADEGFRIATQEGTLDEGIAFVQRVFNHLPAVAGNLCKYRGQAFARVHMAAAFTHFQKGARVETRQDVLQAVRYDLGCVANRGLLSILAQSLLGGKKWAISRRPRGVQV